MPKANSTSWRVWRMREVATSIPFHCGCTTTLVLGARPRPATTQKSRRQDDPRLVVVGWSLCVPAPHATRRANPTLTPRKSVKRVNDAQHDEQHRLPRLERRHNRNRKNNNSRRTRSTRTPPHTLHRQPQSYHPPPHSFMLTLDSATFSFIIGNPSPRRLASAAACGSCRF
jgi:hypothetical protein